MAASTVQNPPTQGDSKSAKKKKAKVVDRTASPAPAVSATPEQASSIAGADGAQDDSPENAHIRELQKAIRTLNKRLTNVNKTETVVKEHSDKTLDQLVTLKVINADQKAQYLKKPELVAQIADLENQVSQHKKLQESFQNRLEEQQKALSDKFDAAKTALTSELEEKATAASEKKLRQSFLTVSQFLRLAAARRAEDVDPNADENLALEGVLLSVYSGDENAVAAMLKLVNGAEEPTQSTAGEHLQTTFAHIKSIAIAHSAALFPESAVELDAAEAKDDVQTDPTVAHAGLTEIDDAITTTLANGHSEEPATSAPANATVQDGAANAAGESQWDTPTEAANDLAESQEWVEVKTADVETPSASAPPVNQSWADDHPETPTELPAAAPDPNDGFQSVQRNRGNRDGPHRGRGRGGGYRGRGDYRGDGRGRGRGGRGGSGGPHRGPRSGGDES